MTLLKIAPVAARFKLFFSGEIDGALLGVGL
jgi:hypothetical protein